MTKPTHWLAATTTAAFMLCAATAGAQQVQSSPQPVAAAAANQGADQGNAATQRQSMDAQHHRPMKRDAPGAANPSGYNPRFSPEGEHFVEQGGARLYQAICQGCHMPQGQGAKGAGFYPALANNPRLAAGAYPVAVVLAGLHGMPSFAERLSDQQVADVVNYVRTNFGNSFQDAVTPEAVNGQRPVQER